ncbi:hypothetical protein EB118_06190 [bacterium]|nr:hypothetical protein [bacterium]
MAITINNLQISGTSNNQNYIEGNWTQNDSVTAMNFSYLSVANSAVSGGAPPGWYALTTNGGVNYGNTSGWIFSTQVTSFSSGNFILFF